MISFILLLTHVFSHSWLECTKYEGDLEVFEKDKCLGLPRPLPGNRNVGGTFGADIGMDFRPQAGGARCQGNAQAGVAANYGGQANLVEYEVGKTYTIAWPPKNHVAAECTNAFIPDTFLKLYMTPYDATQGDPDQDTFKEMPVKASFSDDPHVQGQIDFKGFMNCPRFCDDTDKSLCTGTFTVAENVAPGTYTFQWYWAFNGPADLYATCWEAAVVPSTGTPATPTAIESTPQQPVSTTTTTTPVPTPPGCINCCDGSDIIAPGTGAIVSFDYLTSQENRWLDCPSGFTGRFKIFCLLEEVRLVDGFCNPDASFSSSESDGKDQSGTVAGLSVALVIVIILFALYVGVTQGWICTDEEDPTKWKLPRWSSEEQAKEKPYVKKRADSVLTVSKTELPVLPEAPATWYYTDASNQQQGPVSQMELVKYVKSLSQGAAQNTLVWDGVVCQDWTPATSVPSIKKQLEIGGTFTE